MREAAAGRERLWETLKKDAERNEQNVLRLGWSGEGVAADMEG